MKIRFDLTVRTENFNTNTLINLITYKNNLIEITKYGHAEPLKNKIDKNKLSDITDMFEYYLDITFRGNKKFWMSISTTSEGIMTIGGGMDLNKKDIINIDDIIHFLELFSENNQLLYGYLSSEDEFDDKHKVIDNVSIGWEGVSQWDFFEFLPGIHWYTIFGQEIVNCIGKEKFSKLKNVKYTAPNNNSIAFHLNSPLENSTERQLELENVEKQIGEQYFFNLKKGKDEYSHPEAYKEYLESFGRGF